MANTAPKPDDEMLVRVRRQWNDWRIGTVRFPDLSTPFWDDMSGGVQALAPRPFLHAYIFCTDIVEGEVAHSCMHKGEFTIDENGHERWVHRIKVCMTKVDNPDPAVRPVLWGPPKPRARAPRMVEGFLSMMLPDMVPDPVEVRRGR